MDPNRIEGKGRELKGHLKDTVGDITGQAGMQIEGKVDKAAGKVQDAYGRAKDKVKDEVQRQQDQHRQNQRPGDTSRTEDLTRENPDL
jgi:uncharacterized protein YjbJ (UPF0337 family)